MLLLLNVIPITVVYKHVEKLSSLHACPLNFLSKVIVISSH